MLSSLVNAFAWIFKASESSPTPRAKAVVLEENTATDAPDGINKENYSSKSDVTETEEDAVTDFGTFSEPEYDIKDSHGYRRRAHTVDETPLTLLQTNILYSRHDDKINKRDRNTSFYADRMEKCISLPNLFRASSIQDKSMRITRKRRKYWKRHQSDSNSESENEAGKFQNEREFATKEMAINAKMQTNFVESPDLTDGTKHWNKTNAIHSLSDKYSSDSDEYCSCDEDIIDNNDNVIEDSGNPENCKNKALNRISSIQKRSWSIRQKRRENFYKRRSVDVSTLSQS